MPNEKDGGPAFPRPTVGSDGAGTVDFGAEGMSPAGRPLPWRGAGTVDFGAEGMSLRDWYAGQALAAVIATTSAGQHRPGQGCADASTIEEKMAFDAYRIADAMLRAREGEAS